MPSAGADRSASSQKKKCRENVIRLRFGEKDSTFGVHPLRLVSQRWTGEKLNTNRQQFTRVPCLNAALFVITRRAAGTEAGCSPAGSGGYHSRIVLAAGEVHSKVAN